MSTSTDTEDDASVGGVEPSGEVAGLSYDADEGSLRYDFWEDQLRVLYHLNQPRTRRLTIQKLYRDSTGDLIDESYPEAESEEDAHGIWDIVGALGGYRSGKSTVGSRWIINRALAQPNTRWLVMGQDYAKAKKTTFKVLFQNLPGEMTHIITSEFNGPEHSPVVRDYSRRDKVLTLANNSQIVLGSADDPGRHAGDEFRAAWLDEPSLYGESLHQIRRMISTRLSAGPPAVQLWTYTGNGREGNAAYDIMERRIDEDENDLLANINVVRLSVLRNPFISESTKRGLVRQYAGTEMEEQGLYGGYAVAKGLVYSDFNRQDHVIPESEAWEAVDESEVRMCGYDAGWRDPRVLLDIARNSAGQLIVLDEYYREETHVSHAVKWLQGGLPESPSTPAGAVIWSEHEPSDIQKFRSAGYRAVKADKSIDAGISDVRRRLSRDSRGRVGLLISDRCESLISELQDYKKEEVGTSNAVDHAADALRYAIRGYESVDLSERGDSYSVDRS